MKDLQTVLESKDNDLNNIYQQKEKEFSELSQRFDDAIKNLKIPFKCSKEISSSINEFSLSKEDIQEFSQQITSNSKLENLFFNLFNFDLIHHFEGSKIDKSQNKVEAEEINGEKRFNDHTISRYLHPNILSQLLKVSPANLLIFLPSWIESLDITESHQAICVILKLFLKSLQLLQNDILKNNGFETLVIIIVSYILAEIQIDIKEDQKLYIDNLIKRINCYYEKSKNLRIRIETLFPESVPKEEGNQTKYPSNPSWKSWKSKMNKIMYGFLCDDHEPKKEIN